MSKAFISVILWILMTSVFVALMCGIMSMFRGKSSLKSNRLMQTRIWLQVCTLVVFSILLWVGRG